MSGRSLSTIFTYDLITRLKRSRSVQGNTNLKKRDWKKGYWKNISNQRDFLNELAKKLNITEASGWYTVTKEVLRQHGGSGLLQTYNNSPSKLLTTLFPEYPLIWIQACTLT